MSTSTSAPLSATTTEPSANTEPTIVETLEDAAFILEENPMAVILIRQKCTIDKVLQGFQEPLRPISLI